MKYSGLCFNGNKHQEDANKLNIRKKFTLPLLHRNLQTLAWYPRNLLLVHLTNAFPTPKTNYIYN